MDLHQNLGVFFWFVMYKEKEILNAIIYKKPQKKWAILVFVKSKKKS